jgi:hypothetical protein
MVPNGKVQGFEGVGIDTSQMEHKGYGLQLRGLGNAKGKTCPGDHIAIACAVNDITGADGLPPALTFNDHV